MFHSVWLICCLLAVHCLGLDSSASMLWEASPYSNSCDDFNQVLEFAYDISGNGIQCQTTMQSALYVKNTSGGDRHTKFFQNYDYTGAVLGFTGNAFQPGTCVYLSTFGGSASYQSLVGPPGLSVRDTTLHTPVDISSRVYNTTYQHGEPARYIAYYNDTLANWNIVDNVAGVGGYKVADNKVMKRSPWDELLQRLYYATNGVILKISGFSGGGVTTGVNAADVATIALKLAEAWGLSGLNGAPGTPKIYLPYKGNPKYRTMAYLVVYSGTTLASMPHELIYAIAIQMLEVASDYSMSNCGVSITTTGGEVLAYIGAVVENVSDP